MKATLFINDYDWGPAIDRIEIDTEGSMNLKEVDPKDFEVTVKQHVFVWKFFMRKISKGFRTVKNAAVSGTKIILDLAVHPADPFSNPFVFSKKLVNQWSPVLKYKITNKKLGLSYDGLFEKVCPLANKFQTGKCTTEDITLTYAAWNPSKNPEEKLPLIVWLHGMGEGGTDPYVALLGNRVVNLITEDVQKHFGSSGAAVLVPQTPGFWLQTKKKNFSLETWASNPGTPAKSCYTEALFNLIDSYVKNNPRIDSNRIYIGGCSNGGYMTMNMIIEYPEYFAAAYPVCEAYPDSKIDEEKLSKLAGQKIWFTHAKNDTTVDPKDFTLATYKRLCDAGAKNVHFSFFDDVHDTTGTVLDQEGKPFQYLGHWSWIYTLKNQCEENGTTLMEWLSGSTRKDCQ